MNAIYWEMSYNHVRRMNDNVLVGGAYVIYLVIILGDKASKMTKDEWADKVLQAPILKSHDTYTYFCSLVTCWKQYCIVYC